MVLKLHSAWRASAPYRVRIGLNLKGVAYDYVPVDLVKGQQQSPEYQAVNAQKLVPSLELEDGRVLTQSLPILEWLEETHPEPALLPKDAYDRQVVRAMAAIVACDIHPVNNLRILKALSGLGVDEPTRNAWVHRWIGDGFAALERMVALHGGVWAFGDTPTLADCCLVPQVYNAARFGVDMTPFPTISAVVARAQEHPAIAAAHPNNQPDAVL
ncbi:MAG TPA: maleylacetoacetate isomerase [Caulobacter sp.]|nr:maleylacetoacetate isomerase [Caulobacter sp.]